MLCWVYCQVSFTSGGHVVGCVPNFTFNGSIKYKASVKICDVVQSACNCWVDVVNCVCLCVGSMKTWQWYLLSSTTLTMDWIWQWIVSPLSSRPTCQTLTLKRRKTPTTGFRYIVSPTDPRTSLQCSKTSRQHGAYILMIYIHCEKVVRSLHNFIIF